MKLLTCFLFLFPYFCAFSAEENFLLINGLTDEVVLQKGCRIDQRISPCSTFKIALSLMGYDAGILKDETNPMWDFQEGYDDWLEAWRVPQTPQSWMQYSCIWYSRILASQLGSEKIQNYLSALEYGNEDMSSANLAWITGSLLISPKEQVSFIQKIVLGKLPISSKAIQMTRAILFKEELSQGWKLFGKTGLSGSYIGKDGKTQQHGWFVGWIEKGGHFYPFAYLIQDQKIEVNQRIPRVKELLAESNVLAAD